jgi:hypothetical protein
MSTFTPEQQAELIRIIDRGESLGRNTVLIRQLQAQTLRAGDGTGSTYASGTAGPFTVAAGGTITIPHGLSSAPSAVFGTALGWGGYLNAQAPDATNIYLNPSINLTANYLFWLAIV